jgi:hypothetical protein
MAKGRKTGGRTKGTPNKATPEIREHFRMLIEGELPNLKAALEEVRFGIEIEKTTIGGDGKPVTVLGRLNADPKGYLDTLSKLARFCLPELGRLEHTGEGGGAIVVEIHKYAKE